MQIAKTAPIHLILFVFLGGAVSQNNEGLPVNTSQEFEYTSAPGAPDLIEMLGEYDDNDWSSARSRMQTIKFYHGQVMRKPPSQIILLNQGNTYYNLAKRNAFLNIRQNFKIKTAIEIGAMKPHNCLFIPDQIIKAVEDTVDAVAAVYEAGGSVSRLDIDNSIGHCRATIDDSSFATSRFMMLTDNALNKKFTEMKEKNEDTPITALRWAEIEAYPAWSAKNHLRYIERLNKIRVGSGYTSLEVYFLDIDHEIVNDAKLVLDFDTIMSFCHSQGIKIGLIINGEDENQSGPWLNKDLEYLLSANITLARYKRIGILDKADVIMVQSWASEINGNKTVPRNVPETGISHTNFFNHVIKCAADIVDCEIYPELE